MTKTISRIEFAAMMSDAAMKFPASKGKGDEAKDVKFCAWLRASDVLTSVGEPFATYEVADETREDGFRDVPLRRLADIPADIIRTVKEAMSELQIIRIA